MTPSCNLNDQQNNCPRFSKEEEAELCAKMRAGDMGARDQLFYSMIPWVQVVCAKWFPNLNKYDELFGEVLQAGYCGLLESLDKFDPTKGRLTTFSRFYIIRECRWVLFEDTPVRIPRYQSYRPKVIGNVLPIISLEELIEGKGDNHILSFSNGKSVTQLDVDYHFDDVELLKQCLQELDQKSRYVLYWRTWGLTLNGIGKKLNLTRECIRQIEKKAINNLRKKLLPIE